MNKYKRKNNKKCKFLNIDQKIENSTKSKTKKMLIDFNCLESASIQSFAVKNDKVRFKTRFLSGKMFMFAKLFLMNFIYKLIETFYFPDEFVKKICEKYLIPKIYIYYVLTYTNSTCLKFILIRSTNSDVLDKKFRDIIFEVIVARKIYNRFELELELEFELELEKNLNGN